MKLKQSERDMLAQMLATLDAIFEPIRWGSNTLADMAQWQRRDQYLGRPRWPTPGLLPWSNLGQDAAEKKRLSRALNTLVSHGLARTNGRAAGLTRAGLDDARNVVGWPLPDQCFSGVDYLYSKLGTDHEWIDQHHNGYVERGYISECTMAGYEPYPPGKVGELRLPKETRYQAECIIPLLETGLMDFDFQPNFELPLFFLTDAGRNLAEQRVASGDADAGAWLGLPEKLAIRHVEHEVYITTWEATFNAIPFMKPLDPNRIKHGLSGCMWPDAVLRKEDRYFKKGRSR